MNSRVLLRKTIIIAVVFVVFQLAFGQALFAATTDKDLTLDDGVGDSPKLILQDQTGANTLTLQKIDAGAAEIINNEGTIDFKPSADVDDYLQMVTTVHLPSIMWVGNAVTLNAPGIRISDSNDSGQLQYRDQNAAAWVSFDSIAGSATFGGLTYTNITGIAQGDVVYYNGANWVNLGIGAASEILAVNVGGTAPEWVTKATTNPA